MQDLLLAQQRDRPAYCFQHLDLELRSRHDGYGAYVAAASARLAPWHDVVARFEPEWNSLGENNTRSFNILGGIHDAGGTVLLHSLRRHETPLSLPCPAGCEVSVMPGRSLTRSPLKTRQIRFPH